MKKSLFSVLGFCAFLSACDDVPNIQGRITTTPDLGIFILDAQKAGPVLVKIAGEVSPEGRSATNAAVMKAIEGLPGRYSLTFTRDPNQVSQQTLFLTFLINASPGTSGRELCAGAAGGEARENGEIRVQAGFCRDGQALSEVVGTLGKSEGADAPQVSQLFQQIILALLP